jgi:hypothetical protein
VILGWLFAQLATVAHACPTLTAGADPSSAASAAVAPPMPSDCATLAKQAGSNANVCQSHCVAGEQVDTPAQVPVAAMASLPALVIHTADPSIRPWAVLSSPSAHGVALSALLLFSRLLI